MMRNKEPREDGSLSKNERIKLSNQKQKKNTRRRTAVYALIVLAVAVAGFAALAVTVLFKVNTVEVVGNTRYPYAAIVEASGVEIGKPLLLAKSNEAEENITFKLPYIGSVGVKKKLSGAVVLTVKETTPDCYAAAGAGYVLFNKSGKVLENPAVTIPSGCILVKGLDVITASPGGQISPDKNESFELFLALVNNCDKFAIGKLTEIDVTSSYKLSIETDGKYGIKLGTFDDIDNKLTAAAEIINAENNTSPGRSIIIDVSDSKKAYVRNAEHTTLPPAETTAAETTEGSDDDYDGDDYDSDTDSGSDGDDYGSDSDGGGDDYGSDSDSGGGDGYDSDSGDGDAGNDNGDADSDGGEGVFPVADG